MKYPAITIHQPWASWIAWGFKTIETRTHNRFASLKGQRIAIHAGKAWDDRAEDIARQVINWDVADKTFQGKRREEFPFGAVLCLAAVVDVRELDESDSVAALCDCRNATGWTIHALTGLILADVEPLAEPFKVRGQQGIWHVELPHSIEAQTIKAAYVKVVPLLPVGRRVYQLTVAIHRDFEPRPARAKR